MRRTLAVVALAMFPLLPTHAAGPPRIVGMYVHQHWPYNHPYAARTWTIEDWRGYAGALKRLGFNTIMIWPVVETMPYPPTSSDRAGLEKNRSFLTTL